MIAGEYLRAVWALAAIGTATPSFAADLCPSRLDGHRLSNEDGVSIYLGAPWENRLQAPSSSRMTPAGAENVWTFVPRPRGVLNAVCQYDNYGRAVVQPVPFRATECRQSSGHFSCND